MLILPCPRSCWRASRPLRAVLRGNGAYPGLLGEVLLYPWQEGTLLVTRAAGLPRDGFFALHIHTLGCCRTGGDIPFYCAGGHFDPQQQPHPDHAGDLPVLLSHRGRAFSVTFTGRFRPEEVLGRSVVLHESPDDYRSQPAGDAGRPHRLRRDRSILNAADSRVGMRESACVYSVQMTHTRALAPKAPL